MTTDERLLIAEATIARLQQQAQDQGTLMAQVTTDCVNAVATVNQLKAALDKALSGFELLVEDYRAFKAQTVQHVTALEAAAPKKRTPPPHSMN